MLYALKVLFIRIFYLGATILSFIYAYEVASWYYELKSGTIYDFLKFMSIENSFWFAIVVFAVSFIVFSFLFGLIVGLIDFVLEYFIVNFALYISISFLGILVFPFLFIYAFIICPLMHLYMFVKLRKILLIFRLKFWILYACVFFCVLIALGFLFYYYNTYDFLVLKCKEFSNFILNMKKFDYGAFFSVMFFCFIANIICFVFIAFFKKIKTILYLKISQLINQYEKEQQQTHKEEQKRQKNYFDEKLKIACEIFSIHINSLATLTQEELSKKRKKLAKQFHPDLNKDKKEQMEAEMKEINNAYDILVSVIQNQK